MMSWQEIILYTVWLIVYIFAGKVIIEDMYVGNKKIKGLLWVFWCPFVLGIIIWYGMDKLLDRLKIKKSFN
jgi:hypothetical protein